MKRMHILITGLVIGGTLLTACTPPSLPGASNAQASNTTTAAERVTAEKATIENKIVGTSNIVANTTVSLAFQNAGTVSKVNVQVGDQVKVGQVLATLDDSDLQLSAKSAWSNYLSAQASYSQTVQGPTSADLKKAQASLSSAQAAYNDLFKQPTDTDLAQAKADMANAEAAVKQAQAAYDRRAARDPGVGASQEALTLEQNTNAYIKAKAAYDGKFTKPSNSSLASASAQIQSAKASLESLQPISATITQKQAALDQAYISWQQADKKIKNAVLVSPRDGMVTAVNINAGDSVGASTTTFQVADFAQPIFQVSVDEADLGKVQVGQDALVQLQTYPNVQIPAKVMFITPVGTNSGSVVNYVVKLAISKDAKTPKVLINMSGTGQIITSKVADAIMVPTKALVANSATKEYSVLKLGANGQSESVPVIIGKRGTDKTQILSGVSAGDVLLIPSATGTTNATNGVFGGPPPGGGGAGGSGGPG